MQLFLRLLRDPIWQAISVFVAVIAVLITVDPSTTGPKEIISIHLKQGPLVDQLMPRDKTKVLIDESVIDSQRAVADYYLLRNESNSPIAPQDFVSRLEAHPRNGATILRVQSCSQSFAQACSADGTTTSTGGAFVNTNWAFVDGIWVAEGPLINKDDAACVMVISEPKSESEVGSPLATLSARVTGYNFKSFDSTEAYNRNKIRWYQYLFTIVHFEALAVYWFVFLSAALMFANFRLLQLARIAAGQPLLLVSWQVIVAVFCISTAEILAHSTLSRRWTTPYEQSPIVWPLLAAHLLLVVVLIRRAFQSRTATQ